MHNVLRRLRGAVGMGLTWAIGWGLVGGLIEGVMNILPGSDLHGGVDMWPPLLAIGGFFAGVGFSLVLRVVAGRRRFDELSLPGFTVLGAIGGALLGGVVLATLGPAGGTASVLLRSLVILVPTTALSALSATGTLAIARFAQRGELGAGAAAPQSLDTPKD